MRSESSPSTCPVTAKTNLSPALTAFTNTSQGKQHSRTPSQSTTRRRRVNFGVRWKPEASQTVTSLLNTPPITIPVAPDHIWTVVTDSALLGYIHAWLQQYSEAVIPRPTSKVWPEIIGNSEVVFVAMQSPRLCLKGHISAALLGL